MGSIEQIATDLASDDQRNAYRAHMALERAEWRAEGGNPAEQRKKLAASIDELLGSTKEAKDPKKPNDKPRTVPKLPDEARNALIRALSGVGGAADVSVLRKALEDFEVREMARWALDRMPAERAADVLADAATKTVGDEFRIGVVNSLGRKPTTSAASEALKKCLDDNDPEIRIAAAEALANHADAAHDGLIAAAMKNHPATRSRLANRLARARVRLAENLARNGQKDAARKVYQALIADAGDDVGTAAQRKAAEVSLQNLG
jgi:hypothetical protein